MCSRPYSGNLRTNERPTQSIAAGLGLNTFRALYDALAKLERNMHQHVHKENNILFPRARVLGVAA
jgi:iron-sulfur cluster repair protein YtfE (RIC family)